MASNIDMSLDDITRMKFAGQKKFYGGGYNKGGTYNGGSGFSGGAANKFNSSFQKNPSDLRSVLAKKHSANITDLRAKLKPKALYTSKLPSKSQPSIPPAAAAVNGNNDAQGRKKLRLTASFKNSVSSAVAGSGSTEGHKPSRSRSRRSDPGPSTPHRSSSSRLPSYEEAKKISVTVPGLSKPVSEYSSHRREERLAAQIARSREMRQDGFMRGREEFLASAITSAVGGAGGVVSDGGGSGGLRERGSMGTSITRVQRARSPSPLTDYHTHHSYEPLYSSGDIHGKVLPPPPPPSYSSGGSNRQRGITTATSMFISNLSDTVSKNDVAELCSVVGALDSVYMHAPGIAEVVFKYKDDALEAYKKYNQRNLDGQPMHCKLQPASRSRMSGGGGGSGSGGTYGHGYADDYYSHSSSGFY